ncbi:MAG: GlmU family protein [Raineya sp.]|jgi:UDP-N-acetylglucosamine diphosphorylase/glucosamine-1-phosphate N-acetyltransferase|nr:GlmU family protein [Raineya sp.]
MANFVLFDNQTDRKNLLPLSFLRPLSLIRVGILTIQEKWEYYLQQTCSFQTEAYLSEKYPTKIDEQNYSVYINGTICPNKQLYDAILGLEEKQMLVDKKGEVIAYKTTSDINFEALEKIIFKDSFTKISYSFDIFGYNGEQIQEDFKLITKNRQSQPITDPHTIVYKPENVFIEKGADLKACVLNAEKGVIYIGKNAQIQEMSVIHGNFSLCEGSVINIGGKMRGDTTIGPYSKVGGEISNSVIFGYSNKAHDGFLGNSVLAEWCNLGADTNTSNLKNNYSKVKIWNYNQEDFINTDKQFCGLTMGDYSKSGINTMFNTGTVVGISSNIFGGDFPPKFIPSFLWGSNQNNFEVFEFEKALEAAERMMQRRNIPLTEIDKKILLNVFERRFKLVQ